jgi:hypothetical protein
MEKSNLDDFLNQTFFGLDVRSMLGSVEDFLSFSESNLSWQGRRELQRAEQEADDFEFEEEDAALQASYRDNLIESAKYRFEVSLTQRVRYAALTALVTTVEWCALLLHQRATFQFPPRPEKKNRALHILETLAISAELGLSTELTQIEALIYVRNCIVHGAGFLDHHKHKDDLRRGLSMLAGMQLSNKNFLGESVEITAGALEAVISSLEIWLPDLEKQCFHKGLLK